MKLRKKVNPRIEKDLAQSVKSLIEDESSSDWISWLFDVQNSLIAAGHCESLSRKGSEDFSGKFASLKNFFQDLPRIS